MKSPCSTGYYSFVDGKVVPVNEGVMNHHHEDMPSSVYDIVGWKRAWRKTPQGIASIKRSNALYIAGQHELGVRISLLDSVAVQKGASGLISRYL